MAMLQHATGSAPRKRVRSGCLTCRGRRRKCDEGKPDCSNCRSKNLTCRYGVNVTFVQSKFQHFAGNDTAVKDNLFQQSRSQPQRAVQGRYSSPDELFEVDVDEELVQLEPEESIGAYEDGQQQDTPTHGGLPKSGLASPSDNRGFQPTERGNNNARREQYEMELLTFYRYHVAPILDLGLGSLSFGIRTVLIATRREPIYNAVLALASSRRAAMSPDMRTVDEATSVSSAHFASQDANDLHGLDSAMAPLLLVCRALLMTPVDSWAVRSPELAHMALPTHMSAEQWSLLARLHLAAVLATAGASKDADSLPAHDLQVYGQPEPTRQLCRALRTLEQSLFYLKPEDQPTGPPASSPVQAWLLHWQAAQDWYQNRSEDMQQLFELSDEEVPASGIELNFPCVVFSSACAVVANVAHHVAALTLLSHKPRLAKATAERSSSASPLWHAQRIMGIVASAAESETWDFFLVAAFVHTSQKLSHSKQIQEAARVLRHLSRLSGLHLGSTIERLEKSDGH